MPEASISINWIQLSVSRGTEYRLGLLRLLLWHCILDSLSVCPQSASSLSGGCASFRTCLHYSQGQNYPGEGFCFRSSLDRHSHSFRPPEQGAGVCGPYMETAEHFRGGSGMESAPYHSQFLAFSLLHLGPSVRFPLSSASLLLHLILLSPSYFFTQAPLFNLCSFALAVSYTRIPSLHFLFLLKPILQCSVQMSPPPGSLPIVLPRQN